MGSFVVIYASETGNTRAVAEEIFDAIRVDNKEIIDIRRFDGRLDADVYFVGYWVNHSTCSIEIVTVPGLKNMVFGGEGVFNTVIHGPGKVLLQTMPINSVAGALIPYLPTGN